jgi:hypothetical protein
MSLQEKRTNFGWLPGYRESARERWRRRNDGRFIACRPNAGVLGQRTDTVTADDSFDYNGIIDAPAASHNSITAAQLARLRLQ